MILTNKSAALAEAGAVAAGTVQLNNDIARPNPGIQL
jgi:hypothetical protein